MIYLCTVVSNKITNKKSNMKVRKSKTGRVELIPTLARMEVGDVWKNAADKFSSNYIRVAVCNYGKAANKTFTVSALQGDKVLITRIR